MKNAVTMILEYVEYKHRIEPYMEELAHLFPGEEPCTDDELLIEAIEEIKKLRDMVKLAIH